MKKLTLFAFLVLVTPLSAQRASESGPAIHSAGEVYAATPTIPTPPDIDYKVAFEVARKLEDSSALNATLNSVARFMNMHARAGVPLERIRTAVVVHGQAAFDLIEDDEYQERYGRANPNRALIEELIAFGTPVILCGQTAAALGVSNDQLIEGVEVALSAMTAFVLLQHEGYTVNPW